MKILSRKKESFLSFIIYKKGVGVVGKVTFRREPTFPTTPSLVVSQQARFCHISRGPRKLAHPTTLSPNNPRNCHIEIKVPKLGKMCDNFSYIDSKFEKCHENLFM